MQRQRPSASGFGAYSTTCVLPRESEEAKTSTDSKKETATATKADLKKDVAPFSSSTVDIKRDATLVATLAANLAVRGKDEDPDNSGSGSSSESESNDENKNDIPKKVREGEPNPRPDSSESEESNDENKNDNPKKVREGEPNPYPYKKVPVVESPNLQTYQMVRTAVMRTPRPLPSPTLLGRPLVLATHLVPSLPIGLFEVLVEAIEAATNRAVVILYQARTDRPVCTEVADIAILPAGEKWDNGSLLPVSFVFEHHLNKTFSPAVYADVVVATDRAPHVETLLDLRGHRCALPDRKRKVGASTLLFNYLHSKGEGPAFFGNTLDANSQVSALQMVAGKQVEVCILESPVIKFHRQSLPGVYSLHILSSLGPLPPYPIMVNKSISSDIVGKIKDYLLQIRKDPVWLEKFAQYSVLGFAEYNKNLFDVQEVKPVATTVPYY